MSILSLLLLTVVSGADPRDGAFFTVHRADGAQVQGTLQQVGEGWSANLASNPPVQVEAGNLLALRRTDVPLPALPLGEQIVFANGDRLAGSLEKIAKDRAAFRMGLANGQELTVPLSALNVIWLADRDGVDQASELGRLLTEKRSRDVVWLRNGDRIEGTVQALDKKILQLDRPIERDKVAVIALNTELSRVPRPKGAYGHLVLADGSRLGVVSAKGDGRTLVCKTLIGSTMTFPVPEIIALDVRQGKADYLSDLKPSNYQHTPFNGTALTWPYRNDASVKGLPLSLGGSQYDKGLGMHSQSQITYALAGKYRLFEALVGLDDRTGQKGRVRIKALVDGKPRDLGWNEELTSRNGPKSVRVSVAGAKELTLTVEFGQGPWDMQNHVNWVDARLIK